MAKRQSRAKPDRGRFVAEYLVDLNATQAALRCGYSPKSAHSQGARLLKTVEIAAKVAEAMEKRAAETGVNAKRVLEELGILGFSDIADYLDDDGRLRQDLDQLPAGVSRAIMEITQESRREGRGEHAETVTITKFKLHPKVAALNLIAQHLGMLVQKHELTGKDGAPLAPTAITVTLIRPQSDG